MSVLHGTIARCCGMFFFSSRRRHTRFDCDWSSDVCSSDLPGRHPGRAKPRDPSGDLKSEKAGKKPDDNAGNGAGAREIPDGSDDDVVARRLRQAAQQETDPELKEKLWQEYIDYKKNAQGK